MMKSVIGRKIDARDQCCVQMFQVRFISYMIDILLTYSFWVRINDTVRFGSLICLRKHTEKDSIYPKPE